MATGIDTLKAQWAFLFDLFATNINYGPNGPGSGTNSSGLLQSVASVGQSEWPDFNALPFVGVALKSWTEQPRASNQHLLVSVFEIVAVVNVIASGESAIKLDTAYAAAMSILSDGAGNGILPLLHMPVNYTLGGNAAKIIPNKGRLDWADRPSGKGTAYVAYATVLLTAEQPVGPI